IGVRVLQELLIVRCEIALGDQLARRIETEFYDAVAVVLSSLSFVEVSVSAGDVERVAGIGCNPGSRLPEAAQSAVGSRVPHTLLLESLFVVGDQPSVIRADVAMRSPSDVDESVLHQQSGALRFAMGFKYHGVRSVRRAFNLRLNDNRAARSFCARGDIDGVHFMHKLPVVLRLGDQIHGLRGAVDGGRSGNSDLRHEVGAIDVSAGDDVDARARIEETY